MRRTLAASALTGALLAPPATAAAQSFPITLSDELAPTRVAAWEGTAMWSRYDPATQTYTLVKSVAGAAPIAVGVAPRSGGPFDVDLGTNRSGATYAVYTRDGDIYRLGVATGSETKVAKLSSPDHDERDPTIMRGEIAFIRRNGSFDELRIGNTTSASTGSRRLLRRDRRSLGIVGNLPAAFRNVLLGAELGPRHVAYVERVRADFGERHVRNRNIRTGADRRVYRAASGGANAADVTRPSYVAEPAGFLWARTNTGSGRGNRLVRHTLRGSRLTYAQGDASYNSTAWAGPALGALTATSLAGLDGPEACRDAGRSFCAVELTGPPSFTLQP